MANSSAKIPKFYLAIVAVLCWFALAAQLYLIIQNKVVSLIETLARYFGFFTILTNIMVAICVTALLLKPDSKWGRFFAKPATLTAITVYITIVGAVYNAVLRFLWQPKGLQYVVDELLHTIIPLLFIFLWRVWVNGNSLKYKDVLPWQVYPFAYIIYTAIRDEITGYYPYPFINVTELGYTIVLVNCLVLVMAFLGLSLILVAVCRAAAKKAADAVS